MASRSRPNIPNVQTSATPIVSIDPRTACQDAVSRKSSSATAAAVTGVNAAVLAASSRPATTNSTGCPTRWKRNPRASHGSSAARIAPTTSMLVSLSVSTGWTRSAPVRPSRETSWPSQYGSSRARRTRSARADGGPPKSTRRSTSKPSGVGTRIEAWDGLRTEWIAASLRRRSDTSAAIATERASRAVLHGTSASQRQATRTGKPPA